MEKKLEWRIGTEERGCQQLQSLNTNNNNNGVDYETLKP